MDASFISSIYIVSDEHEKQSIDIDKAELGKVLQTAVFVSDKQPLQSLLDLQSQLNRIVNKYSRTSNRKTLPNVSMHKVHRVFQEI